MKKKTTIILISIFSVIVIAISIGFASRFFARGTATVTIPNGANSVEISKILQDNGIIKSRTYFLARLYFSPYRGKLRYGTFEIKRNSLLNTVFEILSKDGAQKETVTVTIPEGYSVEMIEDKLIGLGLCTKDEFETALKKEYDYEFLKSIPQSEDIKYRLQGFLFPETYEFYKDASAETIINTMLEQFQKEIEPLKLKNSEIFEIITKASMIEREAQIESERTLIAGVFENRLSKNMRLQVDASTAYAVTDGRFTKSRMLYDDLQIDSKYNTYRYSGLPVGPICNPSIESIKAASAPDKNNYLYYHTDTEKNDGSHIFSETFDEHKATK